MDTMKFVAYVAPPTDQTDRAAYEEWLERLQFIADDLHTLLQLPHDKFWCQVNSPVVRAFAHGAMGRRIDPLWWTH